MVPAPYIKLHNELARLAEDKEHLPVDDVIQIAMSDTCRAQVAGKPDAIIADRASALRALKKLASWGAIHYHDSADLRGTVILQPQWLADAMACIIGPKLAPANAADAHARSRVERRWEQLKEGRLDHNQLAVLWCNETVEFFDDTNDALRRYLLATVHTFELAYPLRDPNGQPIGVSLVPAMLGALRPLGFRPFDGLPNDALLAKMRVELSFLPQELFPRLLVRLQQYVQVRADAPIRIQEHTTGSTNAANPNLDFLTCALRCADCQL